MKASYEADETTWMAFYCQSMLEMALTLAEDDPMYEEIACKFIQHFLWISYAMDRLGEHHDEMWDEQDGFFYDLLRLPDGQAMRLKVRSLVGLLPPGASTVFALNAPERYLRLTEMIALFRTRHPEVVPHVAPTGEGFIGYKGRRLLSIPNNNGSCDGALSKAGTTHRFHTGEEGPNGYAIHAHHPGMAASGVSKRK